MIGFFVGLVYNIDALECYLCEGSYTKDGIHITDNCGPTKYKERS